VRLRCDAKIQVGVAVDLCWRTGQHWAQWKWCYAETCSDRWNCRRAVL